MPSRIIREGWLESERIGKLDAAGERFFLRLLLRADDFGRYHANPLLLKSALFPLSEDVRSTDIPRWLAACEAAGLLRCYDADGKRFVEIPRFDQRTRAKVSKFPAPASECPSNDGQMTVKRPADDGHARTDSDSDSDSKSEAETAAPAPATAPPECLNTPAFLAKWAEYAAYRRKSRLRPLIPASIAKQWEEMAVWGHDAAIVAIDKTIKSGWQGIFPPKPDDMPRPRPVTAAAVRIKEPPPGWRETLRIHQADHAWTAEILAKDWSQLAQSEREWVWKAIRAVPAEQRRET
jgi:hypothetical protein